MEQEIMTSESLLEPSGSIYQASRQLRAKKICIFFLISLTIIDFLLSFVSCLIFFDGLSVGHFIFATFFSALALMANVFGMDIIRNMGSSNLGKADNAVVYIGGTASIGTFMFIDWFLSLFGISYFYSVFPGKSMSFLELMFVTDWFFYQWQSNPGKAICVSVVLVAICSAPKMLWHLTKKG